MPPEGFKPAIPASERPQTYALGYGYIWPRTDTTIQAGQTPHKEVEIKNITVYVSGYTETDTTAMLSPPTVWRFSVAADISSNVDMDMSNGKVVHTASLTSYPVRCKILHQRTASLSVTNDVTRPLLCERITCYVTIITHGRCYARA
jgi:hypothetical protein